MEYPQHDTQLPIYVPPSKEDNDTNNSPVTAEK